VPIQNPEWDQKQAKRVQGVKGCGDQLIINVKIIRTPLLTLVGQKINCRFIFLNGFRKRWQAVLVNIFGVSLMIFSCTDLRYSLLQSGLVINMAHFTLFSSSLEPERAIVPIFSVISITTHIHANLASLFTARPFTRT
jgi:hypothetical protein